MPEPTAGLSQQARAGLHGALWTMLLIPAVALLAGCSSAQPRTPPAPVPKGMEEEPPAEPPGHPEKPMKEPHPVPAPLSAVTVPTYRIGRIPARPPVRGRLDVPLKRRWKYIVIHHSSSNSGNMKVFDEWHKKRGWLGVGYDFVIGNGNGSPDGLVEVTFRWERQIQGAHAGVREYNQHGIGICLVGDFEHGYPTQKQMVSLVSLVNYLQEKCRIPTGNILLHRHLKATDCPGKNFPFYKLLSLLPH